MSELGLNLPASRFGDRLHESNARCVAYWRGCDADEIEQCGKCLMWHCEFHGCDCPEPEEEGE